MAFANYNDLKTSVANFLARDDLTARIPDFITLCEARMSRELDSRSIEKRAKATTTESDEFISLPTDLRQIRLVKVNSDPVTVLEFMTPLSLYETYSTSGGGKPKAYTIIGAEIALRPVPDTGYELEIIYGESINALSDSNANNTILTRHPDAYLYGSLANAYAFLMDEQRATQYDALFSRIIGEILLDTEKQRFGGAGLSMKTQYGI